MPTYMVSYDLKTPEKDYSALIEALQEGYRSYWHCLGSTWLIVADQNHTQVRDYLVQHIDTNDQLIVAALGGNAAWHGVFELDHQQPSGIAPPRWPKPSPGRSACAVVSAYTST